MIVKNTEILRAKNTYASFEEAQAIIAELEKELKTSEQQGKPGVGLAAPQIGINKKVAIVRFENEHINLINAKIIRKDHKFIFKNEGCLSVDGNGDTFRYAEIQISDNLCEPHNFIATGVMAVIIQHEMDHLDGVLFTERLVKLKSNDLCYCGSKKKYKRCCRN